MIPLIEKAYNSKPSFTRREIVDILLKFGGNTTIRFQGLDLVWKNLFCNTLKERSGYVISGFK